MSSKTKKKKQNKAKKDKMPQVIGKKKRG